MNRTVWKTTARSASSGPTTPKSTAICVFSERLRIGPPAHTSRASSKSTTSFASFTSYPESTAAGVVETLMRKLRWVMSTQRWTSSCRNPTSACTRSSLAPENTHSNCLEFPKRPSTSSFYTRTTSQHCLWISADRLSRMFSARIPHCLNNLSCGRTSWAHAG